MKKILIYTILLFLTATSYAQHKVVVKVLSGGSSTSSGVTGVATGYGLSGGPIASTGTIIVDSAALHLKFLGLKDSTLYTTTYQNGLKQPLENQRLSTNNVVYFDISQARILAVRDSLLSTNYSYIYTNPNPVSAATILHLPRTSDTLATQTDIPTIAYKKAQTDSIAALKLGYILVTKAQADSLIAINALKKGYYYEISGCDTSLYNDGTTSGTTLILQAVQNNKFSGEGQGVFYNPKYNQSIAGFGIWSNRSTWAATVTAGTFKANELITGNGGQTGQLFTSIDANVFIVLTGDWSTATSITGNTSSATANVSGIVLKSYSIGTKTIWGGYSWTNAHGKVGAKVDILNLNSEWTKNVYDTINYNIAIDVIDYDYANDWISRRYEIATDNEVVISKGNYNPSGLLKYSSISVFMWGNNYNSTINRGIGGNKVINGYFECTDFSGIYAINNLITSGSEIFSNTFADSSSLYNNRLSGSYFIDNTNILAGGSTINNNTVYKGSIQSNVINDGSYIASNILSNGSFIYFNSLNGNSAMATNVIEGKKSYIGDNVLNIESSLNGNNLKDSSYIYNNNLINQSGIYGNALTGNGHITGNNLEMSSTINSNAITNSGSINYNKFSSLSYIEVGIAYPITQSIQYITGIGGIINVDVSAATIVFSTYSKTLYKRPDGTSKLRWYNNSDIMVISNITD